MSNQLVKYIEEQRNCLSKQYEKSKQDFHNDKDDQTEFHRGATVGLKMGLDDIEAILRVAKDFERLGLFK